jgi:hypothetical protein
MVCFVTLEGVDVEYRVLPHESCSFESILDRVALGVVWSDDLEIFFFQDITSGHFYGDFHFSFILSDQTSATSDNSELRFVRAYHPAESLLKFLPVAHVHEPTAGGSADVVFSSELRLVDFARDE